MSKMKAKPKVKPVNNKSPMRDVPPSWSDAEAMRAATHKSTDAPVINRKGANK